MDETYRMYVDYRAALANACENASVNFIGNAMLSEDEFVSVMARLPHGKLAMWQEKFRHGYEQTANEKKEKVVAALASSTRSEKRAA